MSEKAGITITVPFGAVADWRFATEPEEYTDARAERFVKALVQEIKGRSKNYKRAVFRTVYFGGCGPSNLTLEQLYKILQAIYDHLRVEPEEQTMVVVPDTVDFARAKVLRESGFDQMTLRVLAPVAPAVIKNELTVLREAGFFSVGVEFADAVPEGLIQSLLALAPDHIIFSAPAEGQEFFPLLKENYHEFLPGHFARQGKENQHLVLLSGRATVAGFGPGAFSRDGDKITKNPSRLSDYLANVRG